MNDMNYRQLALGETIQEGDEIQMCGQWAPACATIGETISEEDIGHFRRPLPPQPKTTLETLTQAQILRGAILELRYKKEYNGRGLWVLVRDICSVGSTKARAICVEQGWDADSVCGAFE